jgi:hypothetical protein
MTGAEGRGEGEWERVGAVRAFSFVRFILCKRDGARRRAASAFSSWNVVVPVA